MCDGPFYLVGGMTGHASILLHLHKVQRSIESTGKIGDINIERELLVEQLEHIVVGLRAIQQHRSGSDVLRVGPLKKQSGKCLIFKDDPECRRLSCVVLIALTWVTNLRVSSDPVELTP
jgi:hypothetical protein